MNGLAGAISALYLVSGAGIAQPRPAQPPAAPSMLLPVAVFGADDRQPVPAKYQAIAQSVGVLFNNRTRTVCSAFCVGDALIATAAHCLSGAAPGGVARTSDFMFARNYDRSRDLARVEGFANQSSSQNVLTGEFHLSVRPPIDAAYDWALMRLSRPACAKHGLPVKVLTTKELIEEAAMQRIFQIAYHRDYTQWRPAYSKPCGIARDFENADWSTIAPDFLEPDRMILHTCDTGGASSGSPMLLETPDGPMVVGINVGTYVQSKVVIQNGQAAHRQKAETVANTAVNASAFADKIALLNGATILSSSGAIKGLQEGLRRRSFYVGRIDGTYGPSLRTAIQAYERANTLPVTGLATRDLLRRLSAEGSVPSGASHSPSSGQK